jgi:hypothetical protein
MGMLKDLAQRARKITKVLMFKSCGGLVASKIERGKESGLGKGTEEKAFRIV